MYVKGGTAMEFQKVKNGRPVFNNARRKLDLLREFYDIYLEILEGKRNGKAIKRLEEIANDEDAVPMMPLDVGKCYLGGFGVRRNPKKGLEWLEKAKAGADMLTLYSLMEEYVSMCDEENAQWCRDEINRRYDEKERLGSLEKKND